MLKLLLTGASHFCFSPDGDAGGATTSPSPSPSASPSPSPAPAPSPSPASSPSPSSAGAAPPALSFYPTATAEEVAFAQSKGWDKTNNPAVDIFKSYQHLQKMMPDYKEGRMLTLPGIDATKEQMDSFYSKLGRPETADKYNVPMPKENASPELAKGFATKAHELGLTQKQVEGMAGWWNETQGGIVTKMTSDQAFARTQAVEKLKGEWGAAFDQNKAIADEAAKRLGFDEKAVGALGQALGSDGAMKLLHSLGLKTAEGHFIPGEGGRNSNNDGVMTPDQAKGELKKLETDNEFQKAWTDKYNPQHQAAVEKKSLLTRLSMGTR